MQGAARARPPLDAGRAAPPVCVEQRDGANCPMLYLLGFRQINKQTNTSRETHTKLCEKQKFRRQQNKYFKYIPFKKEC